MSNLERNITPEEIATYHRDGGVLLKNIISLEWVDHLRDGLEKLRSSPSEMTSVRTNRDGQGIGITDQFPSMRIPELDDFLRNSPAATIACNLLGTTTVYHLLDQAFYKEAGRILATPWHSDHSYVNIEGKSQLRTWVCCDPSPATITLRIVRGSHRWNVTYRNYVSNESDLVAKSGEKFFNIGRSSDDYLPVVPEIDRYSESFDIISWDVSPGDVVAFDGHILHAAGGLDHHPDKRRAYAIIWGGDDIRYTERPGMSVPDLAKVKGGHIKEGDLVSLHPDIFVPVAGS